MKVETCEIPGVLFIRPRVLRDERGSFFESYQEHRYAEAGIAGRFVQDNRSLSGARVLRGLHYQIQSPQGHLVTVTCGRIFDVGVDLRRASATFGKWIGIEIDADPVLQIYLPPGIAHGFCVLSERAEIWYKCTDYFRADDEGGLLWCDPNLGIDWPIDDPVISSRDSAFPMLHEIDSERLPRVTV